MVNEYNDKDVKVCVLQTDGTNCDEETQHAFNLVGAKADIVHINTLIKGYNPVTQEETSLRDYYILAIPGGFSYGDYVSAGRILAEDMKHFLGDQISNFVNDGKPIIGICNGFQVLVKYGLLPNIDGSLEQTATLTYNDSGRFRCDWVHLKKPMTEGDRCIWTRGIDSIDLNMAHGEGKFVGKPGLSDRLLENGQVVFQYVDNDGNPTMEHPYNPNGSELCIAGICDTSGRIFGLMPHPERYWNPGNHNLATLHKIQGTLPEEGLGLQIFRNGVEYIRRKI